MRKRHTPEQVIRKVREAEADLANGLSLAQVCQKLAVSETFSSHGTSCHSSLSPAASRAGLACIAP